MNLHERSTLVLVRPENLAPFTEVEAHLQADIRQDPVHSAGAQMAQNLANDGALSTRSG